MATNNSNSTDNDELKLLILQLASRLSGIDSKLTGFSEQILTEVRSSVDVKTELPSPNPTAKTSTSQDDSEGRIARLCMTINALYEYHLSLCFPLL